MKTNWSFCTFMLLALFAVTASSAQAQVGGSGTKNNIPKWVDTTKLGNSSIVEDDTGKIGIGTFPSSGIKFRVAATGLAGLYVTTSGSWAVFGSSDYAGLAGKTNTGTGVVGTTDNYTAYRYNTAVLGSSQTGDGVYGHSNSSSTNKAGVIGLGVNGGAYAGRFYGNVSITGTLSKGGGSFKIDHPLDPENKYLYHSFVESPDMKNIYDGITVLDANGEATVELPEWFQALNSDFRYLLTPIGAPGPGLYIAEEMAQNRFRVAGGSAGMKVSWQVTGIRQDAWARKNRIPVEEKKSELERGTYLHPEAFDQPEERGVEWAHDPATMKQLKEAREQMKQNKPGKNR